MAQKKKRDKPCKPRGVNSAGKHGGGGKTRLSETEKVLMGKGLARSFEPIGKRHGEVEVQQKRTRVPGIHKVHDASV